jgi:hypothetical protein
MTGWVGRPALTVRQLLALVALALVAAGLVLLVTRDGVPTGADDAAYLGAARSLDAGHGLNVPIHLYPLGSVSIGTPPADAVAPRPTPLVIYAPLQPVLLAIGGHPVGAARVEDALFLALTVLILGLFVLGVTGSLWMAAAVELILGFSLARPLTSPGTEAAALFFVVLALIGIARYRERPRPAWLLLAALGIGLATLERFALGGLIIWGLLALRRRPRAAVALFLLSSLPLAGWFAYEKISGRTTGHFIGLHVVKTTVRAGIHSLAFWILPTSSPTALALLGALVVAAVVALVLLRARGAETSLFVLFAVVEIVILEVAITFVDAGVNLDSREFIPIYVAVVVGLACGLAPGRTVKLAALLLVVGCGLRFGIDSATQPAGGYLTPHWTHSPVLADVRALPTNAVIYTDAPDVLYLLDGRATSTVPETVDFSTLQTNPHFMAQIAEIRRTLSSRPGYVVYIRGLGRQSFVPSEASLRRLLSLQLVKNTSDGAIYTVGPPS